MQNQLIGKTQKGEERYLSDKRQNDGVLIVGSSGSGKSQTATMLLSTKKNYQGKILTFNWHRCLDRDTLMPKVKENYEKDLLVIDVKKEKLGVPLFNKITDKDGHVESDEDVIYRITKLYESSCGMKRMPSLVGKFKDSVEAVMEEGSYPRKGADAFCRWLKSIDTATGDKTLAKVEPLCRYIKDGNFLDTDAKIIELDLNGLFTEDQAHIVEFVLGYIYRLSNMGIFMEKGITVYVDEAQGLNYKDDDTPVCMILDQGRKQGVDLLLAVQSLRTTGKKGFDVINQCATKLFFKPIDGEEKIIANMIEERRRVDRVVDTLKTLSKGRYLGYGHFKNSDAQETDEEIAHCKKEKKIMMFPGIK